MTPTGSLSLGSMPSGSTSGRRAGATALRIPPDSSSPPSRIAFSEWAFSSMPIPPCPATSSPAISLTSRSYTATKTLPTAKRSPERTSPSSRPSELQRIPTWPPPSSAPPTESSWMPMLRASTGEPDGPLIGRQSPGSSITTPLLPSSLPAESRHKMRLKHSAQPGPVPSTWPREPNPHPVSKTSRRFPLFSRLLALLSITQINCNKFLGP